MRRVYFVRGRDGEYQRWRTVWLGQGYALLDLNIDERDPADGLVGRAHELQGPLRVS